jgi:hypothetical protein
MLIVFWGIHGIANYCWFLKDDTLDSSFSSEEVLSPLAQKYSQIPKNSQTLDFDSYGQCNGSHGTSSTREIGCFSIQIHPAATVEPEYCTIRILSFRLAENQA